MQITNDMINIILSSTLLVGIISSIVSVVINKKNNNLKYVTEDRRLWREKIRDIVAELENSKLANKRKVLQKLKVLINPYGESSDNVLQDSHIWELIRKMEDTSNISLYREQSAILIFYLSLLLKYDWERTKKEVTGDGNLLGLKVTFVFGTIYLVYKHFIEYSLEYNEVFLFACSLFLFIPMLLGQGSLKELFKEEWNRKRKNVIVKWGTRILAIISSILICLAYFIILPIYVLLSYNFELARIVTSKGYLDTTIVITVMTLLFVFSRNFTTQSVNRKYVQIVKEYRERQEANHQ